MNFKIIPSSEATTLLYLSKLSIKILKLRCLTKATISYHSDFFTFILPLEGRTGKAWEPSNRIIYFIPLPKYSVFHFSSLFSLYTYSLTVHSDSLSSCFKGLRYIQSH
jgi:hypothetical protein